MMRFVAESHPRFDVVPLLEERFGEFTLDCRNSLHFERLVLLQPDAGDLGIHIEMAAVVVDVQLML